MDVLVPANPLAKWLLTSTKMCKVLLQFFLLIQICQIAGVFFGFIILTI